MSKKLSVIAFLLWLFAILIWQFLFYNHSVISEILWEIHCIFSSVILFYFIVNILVKDETLDFIKICFRIVFKVWLIIFIAFSMHNSFNQKGFILTSTFIFGYLEGLIDVNAWLRNNIFKVNSKIGALLKTKSDKIKLSIIAISIVHFVCAFIALIFFNID
jgi:hypothetical protein